MALSITKSIKSFLNLEIDNNQKWILSFSTVSTLLITFIMARMQKEIITELPAEFISIQSIVASVSGLVISLIWKGKVRKSVIKYFWLLAILESSAGFILSLYLTFVKYDVMVFAIASLIYTSLVSRFVGKALTSFESKLWNNTARERYINNHNIIDGIVCIIGFSLSVIAMPSLEMSIIIWGICCVLDDLGWLIVYFKNHNTLVNDEQEF